MTPPAQTTDPAPAPRRRCGAALPAVGRPGAFIGRGVDAGAPCVNIVGNPETPHGRAARAGRFAVSAAVVAHGRRTDSHPPTRRTAIVRRTPWRR